MLPPPSLSTLPQAPCAVAVSGGADSVALLRLLMQYRPDIPLHVVHLDHQTRGVDSTGDADFVRGLADEFQLPCTIARRSDIEGSVSNPPRNKSAFFRALRHALFRQVITQHNLRGVFLAHHADDQAETVFHRLLRGSGPAGLAAMASETRLPGLLILRPLLTIARSELRDYLRAINQPWREDLSNLSPAYFRNRLRRLLAAQPQLASDLLNLSTSCAALRNWIRRTAPELPPTFYAESLLRLPPVLAAESARRWLLARKIPADQLTPEILARFLTFATDAASPRRQHFPGKLLLHRRQGQIRAERQLDP